MHPISSFQHPPPANETDFENLCLALWKALWNDPSAQKVGRRGQAQHGVDVVGTSPRGGFAGVQCKSKTRLVGSELTEGELLEEVEKAKKFEPPLAEFTIATSSARDAHLQKVARQLTQQHRKRKLFSVTVMSWDDILIELDDHPHLAARYLNAGLGLHSQPEPAQPLGAPGTLLVTPADVLLPEHQAEAAHAQSLLDAGHLDEVHTYLLAFRDRTSAARPEVKSRVQALLAATLHRLRQEKAAAAAFFEAAALEPEGREAIYYRGIGHLLMGDLDGASRAARELLERNPLSEAGYSLLLQAHPGEAELSALTDSLPPELRSSRAVSFAAGIAAERRGDHEAASRWLATAAEPVAVDRIEEGALLGTALLEQLEPYWPAISSGEFTPRARAIAERAAAVLADVWRLASSASLGRHRPDWLHNLTTTLNILGRRDEAIRLLLDARERFGLHPRLTRQLALLYLSEGRAPEAAVELAQLDADGELDADGRMLLAEALGDSGDVERVEGELRRAAESATEDDARTFALRKLAAHLGDRGEADEALRIIAGLRESFPGDLGVRLDEIRWVRAIGRTDAIAGLVAEAVRTLDKGAPTIDVRRLAHLLASLDMYADAAAALERIVEEPSDTTNAFNLAYCYHRAGENGRCLALCKAVRERFGPRRDFGALEAEVLVEIGDRNSALTVLRACVEAFPDDAALALDAAALALEAGDASSVDTYLETNPDARDLGPQRAIRLAALCRDRGRVKKGLDIVYEARRTRYGSIKAHEAYLAYCFEPRAHADVDPWLEAPERVADSAAILLRDDGGNERWYVIDSRPDPDMRLGELPPSHPTALRLLDRRVGDRVELGAGSAWSVAEIKSKYLFALHDTIHRFEDMFPEQGQFRTVKFPAAGDAPARADALRSAFESLFPGRDTRKELFDHFAAGSLPIGLTARLLGKDVIELWQFATGVREVGRRIALGPEPASPAPAEGRLAADLTALLTIEAAGLVEPIASVFGPILVAQSTLDEIERAVEERATRVRSGYRTLGFYGGVAVPSTASEDELTTALAHVERLRDAIRPYIEPTAVLGALSFDRERRVELSETLGESFADSALIAHSGHLLYTDDGLTRGIAEEQLGVRGVSTLELALACAEAGALDGEQILGVTLRLLSLNYFPVPISAVTLVRAADASGWRVAEPFCSAAAALRPARAERESAMAVAQAFLQEMLARPLPRATRDHLAYEVLGQLTHGLERAYERKWIAGRLAAEVLRRVDPDSRELAKAIGIWRICAAGSSS